MKPRYELDEKSVAIDKMEKFKRKLSEFGYGSGPYTVF